jgi:general secretion pathway protein F
MTVYKFEAFDVAGKLIKGTIEADTVRQARLRLRDRQLTPLTLDPLEGESANENNWRIFGKNRFSSAELSLITRQISTLLTAGLTVDQTLSAIIEQSEVDYTKEVMLSVRAEVMSGSTLSSALAKYPKIFPEIYRSIIYAGEESGKLANVTLRLAEYTESRHLLKNKVVLAFIYPTIVTIVAIMVISGLLIYVVPQVVSAFDQSKQTLPFLTRALIGLSDFLRVSWPYLVSLIIIIIFAAKKALKNEHIRFLWHKHLLNLPLAGSIVRGLNTARLASTLAMLVGSGVPIINAMKVAAQIIDNLPMRKALEDAIELVRDGTPLSSALKTSQLFPPILIHMIYSAESTGQLDKMLDSAANQQSRELENRIGILTELMEPLLILVMGGMVLIIVLAILLPIIEMNQLIH